MGWSLRWADFRTSVSEGITEISGAEHRVSWPKVSHPELISSCVSPQSVRR